VEALGEVLPTAMRAVNHDGPVARYIAAGCDIGAAVPIRGYKRLR
jgi:hypothetical protein